MTDLGLTIVGLSSIAKLVSHLEIRPLASPFSFSKVVFNNVDEGYSSKRDSLFESSLLLLCLILIS